MGLSRWLVATSTLRPPMVTVATLKLRPAASTPQHLQHTTPSTLTYKQDKQHPNTSYALQTADRKRL
jgi:hypothetical protein